MGDNVAGNDPVDRALRIFVYGPLGLACYLKDSAPTFTELFVSRGKRELDNVKRTVEEKLGRSQPEPPPAPSPQQRVADSMAGLSKVAAQATSLAASMAGPVVKAGAGAAATAARTVTSPNGAPPPTNGDTAPTGDPSTAPGAPPTGAHPGDTFGTTGAAAVGVGAASGDAAADLPIAGYDGLSASQVIERLEGMSRGALERVRVYERAHRARRTILASIDNLTS